VIEIHKGVGWPQTIPQLFTSDNGSWVGSQDSENVKWKSQNAQANSPFPELAGGNVELEDAEADHLLGADQVSHGNEERRSGWHFLTESLKADRVAEFSFFQEVRSGQANGDRRTPLALTRLASAPIGGAITQYFAWGVHTSETFQ
jgi:hypothetical protein